MIDRIRERLIWIVCSFEVLRIFARGAFSIQRLPGELSSVLQTLVRLGSSAGPGWRTCLSGSWAPAVYVAGDCLLGGESRCWILAKVTLIWVKLRVPTCKFGYFWLVDICRLSKNRDAMKFDPSPVEQWTFLPLRLRSLGVARSRLARRLQRWWCLPITFLSLETWLEILPTLQWCTTKWLTWSLSYVVEATKDAAKLRWRWWWSNVPRWANDQQLYLWLEFSHTQSSTLTTSLA